MPEYPLRPVIELADNFDAARRPVKASDRRPGPYPYYGAQGIVDRVENYLFDGEFVLVAEDGENLRSRKEPIALMANGKFWVNNHAHILRGKAIADTRFLFYCINASDVSGYVTGSTIPKLSQGNLNRILLPCPPIGEQRAIASLLGALDSKIDLNRRMNETLEALARTIFKDWFVDFGPSWAKMKGHAPYLAPELWALFPDRLDDEGRPEGWTEEPLLDHARLISGGTPRTNEPAYWGGNVLWASARDVSQCSDVFLTKTERTITERALGESATRTIAKLATVVVARGATTGRFCMFGRGMAMNQTCYALSSVHHRPFWLNCAFSYLVDALVHAAHGSVFDTITTKTIESARVTISSGSLLDHFEEVSKPLFNQILANVEQAEALVSTRDILLPKLISGEISLRDAEKIAEMAA